MVTINIQLVEDKIAQAITEITQTLKIDAVVNKDFCPGTGGISSQILITIMSRIEDALDVTIPNNCYIFHNSDGHKQLNIGEASQKLLSVATKKKKI